MKITKKELEKLIEETVNKKLSLKESRDFTAKRQIIQAAQNASMNFESEMNSLLNLVNPDEMPAPLQKMYFEVVEDMKVQIVKSVTEAVQKLAKLPRKDQGGEK